MAHRQCTILYMYLFVLSACNSSAQILPEVTWQRASTRAANYSLQLQTLRQMFGGAIPVPAVPFFAFGMGDRRRLLYLRGRLYDAVTNATLYSWSVAAELLLPPDYTVLINTTDGHSVSVVEDALAVVLTIDGVSTTLTNSSVAVTLPEFTPATFNLVLKVLHQEILFNTPASGITPNVWVYSHPWRRDGALMALVLNSTGNTHLALPWIASLTSPFDMNAGVAEPDNLGETLLLLSLLPPPYTPLLAATLAAATNFTRRNDSDGSLYLIGSTDGGPKPQYQTKWFKYGLDALGMHNMSAMYSAPLGLADPYATLFWQGYVDRGSADRSRFHSSAYPYLVWAQDHYWGSTTAWLNDASYPLTVESDASRAAYAGMRVVDPIYFTLATCVPHGWHAAEAFLYLLGL